MSYSESVAEKLWFYEDNGQRKGPVSQREMIQLIKSSIISNNTSVWKQGFADWLKVEDTDLHIYLDHSTPPPLVGGQINNTTVWVLAFAPVIGYILEFFIASMLSGGSEAAAVNAMVSSKYWFVSLLLNVALSILDEKQLKNAGHNTDKFRGWVWLVPVYLYQRAKATKQNLAYFIVWLICFFLMIIS